MLKTSRSRKIFSLLFILAGSIIISGWLIIIDFNDLSFIKNFGAYMGIVLGILLLINGIYFVIHAYSKNPELN